jgi:pimeloyl-ACP methyl ester carboxylesterase
MSASFVTSDDAGHFPWFEGPEQFREEVAGFLSP